MTLEELREITLRKQATDREWRAAVELLARELPSRQVAKAAGIGHVTVHRYARQGRIDHDDVR
jgi:DNA invertase Pin-like site-specific DNA recombinase